MTPRRAFVLSTLAVVVGGVGTVRLIDATPVGRAPSCGVERWAVKTATDRDARRIVRTPRASTVAAIGALSPPADLPRTRRVVPFETTVWRVEGHLTEWKREDDSDYHAVVVAEGASMIVEFPIPGCARGSALAAEIATARRAADALLSPTRRWEQGDVPVVVEGPGFFDECHGQRGRAPNCAELHPVTRIERSG